MPADGINDYVDLTLVVNPWQALVICALIFALLIWPSLANRQVAKRIEKSITETNGGHSVVDRFDQLDKKIDALDEKVVEHITWSDGYVAEQAQKLHDLEAGRIVTRRRRRWFRR